MTLYPFNTIANQLTEEEFERNKTSKVSVFFEDLFITLG